MFHYLKHAKYQSATCLTNSQNMPYTLTVYIQYINLSIQYMLMFPTHSTNHVTKAYHNTCHTTCQCKGRVLSCIEEQYMAILTVTCIYENCKNGKTLIFSFQFLIFRFQFNLLIANFPPSNLQYSLLRQNSGVNFPPPNLQYTLSEANYKLTTTLPDRDSIDAKSARCCIAPYLFQTKLVCFILITACPFNQKGFNMIQSEQLCQVSSSSSLLHSSLMLKILD